MTLWSIGKAPSPRASELLVARCTIRKTHTSASPKQQRFSSTLQIAAKSRTHAAAALPPLSALPTKVLLRSLLVSTISSKPLLLSPSLWLVSILAQPNRGWLTNVDRNPILHAILKKTFYEQFCAGETVAETRATIRELKDMGFRGVMMTYAKETVFDHRTNTQHGLGIAALEAEKNDESLHPLVSHCANIEAWREGTLKTVEQLNDGDILAVKLTGAGPVVTEAFSKGELPPVQMLEALDEVCSQCKDRNVRIIVDAESHYFLSGILRVTLDLMRKYNRDGHALIYNTYQCYLKSTPATIERHLTAAQQEGFTLGLKLVRGAYLASDERSLIHDTKQDTDDAYNGLAQGALKQTIGKFGVETTFPSVNLFLASHNKASVVDAHQLHKQRTAAGLPTVPVGFAQLHGMSDEVSFSLLQLKGNDGTPEVYKCSTWGTMGECLAYLLRRAIENRDAVLRTGDEYNALKAEFGRRFRAVFSFSSQK
ncbi:FAD-linked oxidoreductase-like protein [Penicillium verhagenii]|uniref:FAD-linked oxidoreductase-like protein n=1 Tax=Penicillium verhagenii TaxID=1562060 RepID=UPI0025450B44|nr:FAD-linked oxidoreductase-like protein [Penicillium verhagenii]KAJ5919253.1 FAD-linked oxidoreductase-like protein [Penicillium verhagenii]